MSLNDPLANVLSHILNSEKVGKKECIVTPLSNLLRKTLQILKDNNYIGEFEVVDERKGGLVKINLLGAINKCGVIKPRFSVGLDNFEKYEKRYLPARNFGLLIVSTSKGLMTHSEAIQKELGGKLIAYCY